MTWRFVRSAFLLAACASFVNCAGVVEERGSSVSGQDAGVDTDGPSRRDTPQRWVDGGSSSDSTATNDDDPGSGDDTDEPSGSNEEGPAGDGLNPDENNGPGPGSGSGGAGSDNPSPPENPCEEARRATPSGAVHRLSSRQREGTLRALLGPLYERPEVSERVGGMPSDLTATAGDFTEVVPVSVSIALSQIAEFAATEGLGDAEFRGFLHECATSVPIETDCATRLIEDFGARVWRRPLSGDDIDDYVAFFEDAGAGEDGLAQLLRRLLQAPSLVYHLELGELPSDEAPAERVRLSHYEVASRLAYSVTDAPPDAELRSAAEAGELETVAALSAHAERLLETERGRAKVLDFGRFYAALAQRSDPEPAVAALQGFESAAGLGAAAHAEARRFIEHIVYSGQTFADLMTSTRAFPESSLLAQVLGTDTTSSDGPEVFAESHPGLLHRPALLIGSGRRTNLIVRGAHLRKLFLCTDLPLPNDVNAVAAAQEEIRTSTLSNREVVTAVTAPAICSACHSLVNPLGFAFEGYDQLGMPRDNEVVLDETGEIVGTFPIDTSVESPNLGSGGPDMIADSHELVEALAHSDVARACFDQRLIEYYQLRELDSARDACRLSELAELGADAPLLQSLARAVANEDALFREHSP